MLRNLFLRNKYKEATHAVANLLMRDWNQIMDTSRDYLRYGLTDEEAAKLESADLYFDMGMAMLGVMTYIVAGLGKPEVATQMVEIYKDLYKGMCDEIPDNLLHKVSVNEAANRVNRHYQKARELADEYMRQGKGLDQILHAFAVSVFIWIGSKYDEDDVAYIENALTIFHNETQRKFQL